MKTTHFQVITFFYQWDFFLHSIGSCLGQSIKTYFMPCGDPLEVGQCLILGPNLIHFNSLKDLTEQSLMIVKTKHLILGR